MVIFAPRLLEEENFVFYDGKTQYYTLKNAAKILKHPNFHKNRKTVLYIHGFMGNVETRLIQNLLSAYKSRGDYNVLAIDWSDKAQIGYFKNALPNMFKVGENVADYLMDMSSFGLDLNKLHIVGHSLGGQMAGVIGRRIQYVTSGKKMLTRITALDPALPGFGPLLGATCISKTDAKIVEVIHTDAGCAGIGFSCGTVDFWPNSGYAPQPGCQKVFKRHECSHNRALEFWTESVIKSNSDKFFALKAKSWEDFKASNTEPFDPEVAIGPDLPKYLTGNYYLETNAESPYAKGLSGIFKTKMLRNYISSNRAPTDVKRILIFLLIMMHLLLIAPKRF